MKQYNFRVFEIENKNGGFRKVICFTEKTRNGFKHVAVLEYNEEKITVNYLNRTWESFEYQTVLNKLIADRKEKTGADYTLIGGLL